MTTATTPASAALATRAGRPVSTARAEGRRQGLVLVGQLVAGVGNLVASVLVARALPPGEYAAFTAFLAGYVLLHAAASAVTAATALDPRLHHRLLGVALGVGLAVGAAVAGGAPLLAPAVGLPVGALLLLGLAAPSAGLLALARGRLYGTRRTTGTALNLAVEPVARIGVGLALLPALGPVGAAAGVVAGGYVALAVALVTGRRADGAVVPPARAGSSLATAATFLSVAVVAAQDVLVANTILAPAEAGLVAAAATVGGAAYFATATIPMVLLPSRGEADGGRGSLGVAVVAAILVSLAAVACVALVPGAAYAAVLGEPYRGVGALATAYVAAMGALGTGKVLLARLCVLGRGGCAALVVAASVALQLWLLLESASAWDVVLATVTGSALLLTAGAAVLLLGAPAPAPAAAPARDTDPATPSIPTAPRRHGGSTRERARETAIVLTALAVGLSLRLLVTRSIWLDEAISIRQAQLPYAEMLVDLRTNDVHPPGYHTVMWALVHLTGSTAEWVVRMPSLVAGTAMVPLFYAMARDLWDRRTGRVAAFAVAVAPLAVWYSQEARMYALWMLTATVATWALLRVLRDGAAGGRGRPLDWAGIAIGTVAMVYLQWFAALPVLVVHLVLLVAVARRRTRRLWRGWLLAMLGSAALVAPLVPFAVDQMASVVEASAGAPAQAGADASAVGGDSPDVYAVLANTIWAGWGYHADGIMVQVSACWPVLLLVALGALGRGVSRHVLVLGAVALVPVAMLFVIGFERRQLFELRYFTTLVPLLLLLVSRGVASWGRGPVTRLLLPALLVASLGAGLADQQVNQSNPRTYDFRGAVDWVRGASEPGDRMVYAPEFLDDEMTYYDSGLPTAESSVVDGDQRRAGLPVGPRTGVSLFVFGSFLDEPAVASELGRSLAELEEAGWHVVDRHESTNITVWQLRGQQGGTR